jgi:hypothetical protein
LRDEVLWLMSTPWAQHRIGLIAAALLERGTLSGKEIDGVCGPREPVKPEPHFITVIASALRRLLVRWSPADCGARGTRQSLTSKSSQ